MSEGLNEQSKRYNTKVEIPISVILETIFSDDNRDVETLCRWAKHYGFVDLIKKNENDKLGYYKLQDDYKKQSFYMWLSKEERKQYEYEDYLIDQLQQKENTIKEARECIKENMKIVSKGQAEDTRLPVGTFMWNVDKILEILDRDKDK